MKKWIQRLLGLDRILTEREKTNSLLDAIYKELKRNSDLVEKYNKAHHIN